MAITRSDFYNWKQDQVTQAVLQAVLDRGNKYLNNLTGFATDDISHVNWIRGYVYACQELVNVDFEDTNEDE